MSIMRVRKRVIKRPVPTQMQDLTTLSSTKPSKIDTSMRSITLRDENRRKGSTVSKGSLELLYRMDGLTFRIVQKYVEKMVGGGYVIKGGSDASRLACENLANDINLKYLLSEIVRDIFVTGNGTAWTEIGYNEDGTDILVIKMINPKSGITFVKDDKDNVLYDRNLRPVGFKLGGTLGFPKMEWYENEIKVEEEVVWTPSKPGEDGRDRIAYWKLVGVGEEEEGMSPLEPGYKASIVRLNLEDTVGNAAFRSLAVMAIVGDKDQPLESVTDAQLDAVKNKLRELDQDTVWAFRRNVEISKFPMPDITGYEELMYYFADLASSGSGIGISLILQPAARGYRGDIEIKQEEFMDSVKIFQQALETQIKEFLFKRLLRAKGHSTKNMPYIKLIGKESGIALSTSRRLSTYARYGILTPDPELEDWIRENEGLPPLDEEIKKVKYDPKNMAVSQNSPKEDPDSKKPDEDDDEEDEDDRDD